MKTFNQETQPPRNLILIPARALLVAGILLGLTRAWSQTAPVLTIKPFGTNQFSVTISNAIPAVNYEIWWTPNLGNIADYPWTMTPPGIIGQTNFLLENSEYPAVFFQGVLDTNNPPLWENADPSNPGTNFLKVTIASPANGAVLQ